MRDKREFMTLLKSLHGQPAEAMEPLFGEFDFTRFVLKIRPAGAGHEVGGEVMLVLHVPQLIAAFPPALFKTAIRRTALEDYLTRKIGEALDATVKDGTLRIAHPGSQILPRTVVSISQDYVEARLLARISMVQKKVDAPSAVTMFFHHLPAIVNHALIHCYHDSRELSQFISAMEDADAVRHSLAKRGLIAFVQDATRLPGVSQPLGMEDASLIPIEVPNAGSVRGMGIPSGVTLIVGDPYSGRRELMAAIASGIYNHVPSDGRSGIISSPDLVAVETEPGRPVQRVDISAFIDFPEGSANDFSTESATAIESQMAGVAEAVEAGARALIFDEDTSVPAFLAANVSAHTRAGGSTLLTPLSQRARQIADQWGTSVIVGACACAEPFIASADAIWLVEQGRIRDVTQEVKKERAAHPDAAGAPRPLPTAGGSPRLIIPSSIDPSFGEEDARIRAQGADRLVFGRSTISLKAVPQLVEIAQVEAAGLLLYYTKLHYLDEARPITELLDEMDKDLAGAGLDSITRDLRSDLARARRYEIAAALNRLPTLRVLRP
ncbi:MAG: hypothetical protein KBA51_02235 [Kiritimatiellae bacterium]|nr:hypothetical protein [Kiritimatiellia bacterium]